MIVSDSPVDSLDNEWFALILEARQLGLTIDAVQEFLKQDSK